MQIEGLAIRRRKINFEIARVNKNSNWSFNRQRNAIHQAMRYPDRLNRERPNGELVLRLNLYQLGLVQQLVFFQLAFDIGQGKFGGVDRHIQFAQNPRKSTDVVFMTVGENDAANALPVLHEVGDIGNHDIHAKQLSFGKHQAGIDDDDV